GLDLGAAGLGAHRDIAAQLLVLEDRRGIGAHPIVVAVLAAVLDHRSPGSPLAAGIPEILVSLGWHVWMAHDVVRRAEEFLVVEAADLDECGIRIRDASLGVGGRQ